MRVVLAALTVVLALPAVAGAQAVEPPCESRALGLPNDGRLLCGVQLQAGDDALVTWDPIFNRSPNRAWRRWGTQKLVSTIDLIAIDYAERFPIGPRLVVGDLSRTRGGKLGGHDSHQNGLDVDIYYPRRDGLETSPERVALVDRRRAQWLVNRAARADAQYVFIGPRVGLRRPRRFVQRLVHHDNHLHLRIRP